MCRSKPLVCLPKTMDELYHLRKAIQITTKLESGVKLDDEAKFYKKIKGNINDTLMKAVNETGIFSKQLPNRDRVMGNICTQGKVCGTKDNIVSIFAKAFVKEVFSDIEEINNVKLPL